MIQYDKPENVRAGDTCLAEVPAISYRRGSTYFIRTCRVVERFGSIVRVTTPAKKAPFEIPIDAISTVWRDSSTDSPTKDQ